MTEVCNREFWWTPEADAALMAAFALGKSSREIGLLLGGKSRNAVIGRCRRLGLVWPSARKDTPAAINTARTVRRRPPPPKPREERAPEVELPIVGWPHARHWLWRGFDECAYPVSGNGYDTVSCCAPIQREGSRYCPRCRKLMYTPRQPKARRAS